MVLVVVVPVIVRGCMVHSGGGGGGDSSAWVYEYASGGGRGAWVCCVPVCVHMKTNTSKTNAKYNNKQFQTASAGGHDMGQGSDMG